ncbi:MAG: hypothetical protein ACLPY5_04120 [Candidatus Bathyarchaeia archaeon]
MKKQGYRESTIESSVSSLKSIANLLDPESVQAYLANANLKESRKETLVIRLARFYKWNNTTWQPPLLRDSRFTTNSADVRTHDETCAKLHERTGTHHELMRIHYDTSFFWINSNLFHKMD